MRRLSHPISLLDALQYSDNVGRAVLLALYEGSLGPTVVGHIDLRDERPAIPDTDKVEDSRGGTREKMSNYK